MPLCGSSFCGCAITSVPVAAGDGYIDGAYPTITVDGNGTGASPWVLSLNDEWASAVASKFRGIQGLQGSGTTQADGSLTVSYGQTYASVLAVLPVIVSASTAQMGCHLISVGATSFTMRVTRNDAPVASEIVSYRALLVGTVNPPE